MSSSSTSSLRNCRPLARRQRCLGLGELLPRARGSRRSAARRRARGRPSRSARSTSRCACSSSLLDARGSRRSASFSACQCAFMPDELLAQLGQLALDRLAALRREASSVSFCERLALDLELHDAALDLVDLGRHRVDLDAQPGGRLVDQVDRLVGQEAVGDVAVRERRRGDERRVLDAHAVVDLVALLEAAQDRDRVLDARLADVAPAGSAARAPRPSRCACGTRRAWWRRRSAARRARASA